MTGLDMYKLPFLLLGLTSDHPKAPSYKEAEEGEEERRRKKEKESSLKHA